MSYMLIDLKKPPKTSHFNVCSTQIYSLYLQLDLVMNTYTFTFDFKQVWFCMYSHYIVYFFLL